MTSLSERMDSLKENSNTTLYSEAEGSLPLSTFLAIYEKSQYDCYIEYMKGAIALHKWLTSSGKYPLIMHPAEKKPHRLLVSYELNELDKIVAGSLDLDRRNIASRSIFRELML